MSYSVVFVEDEQIVREEIVSSIRWELLGLELVGTAADGLEGEQLIKRVEPDIVITDIRGAVVYRTTHRPAGLTGIEFSGSELGLSDGLYLIRATNEEGDNTQRLVVGK